MAAHIKYQGIQKSRNKTEQSYKQIYQGTETQINAITIPTIGTKYTGKGYFTAYRKVQQNGPFYTLELEYTTSYSSKSFNNTDDQRYGKKSAQLSVRNLQLPLENHTDYHTNWNYYLIGKDGYGVPGWWSIASDTIIPTGYQKYYKWVKSASDCPTQKDKDGDYWKIIEQPTKPGVQVYQFAQFVVTIAAKYSSAANAGSSISKSINTIKTPSETFGITGGNWKLDEGNVSYDGKAWIATEVYTHSPDGWDTDLYD